MYRKLKTDWIEKGKKPNTADTYDAGWFCRENTNGKSSDLSINI